MSKVGTVKENRLQWIIELTAERRKVELLTQELEVVKAELRALKGSDLSGYSRFNGKGYSAQPDSQARKKCPSRFLGRPCALFEGHEGEHHACFEDCAE